MNQRWKLTIEYDGTDYSGWQTQEDGVPTIQKTIEVALYKFCQQDLRLHVAGRTDAGVHARGQVAHFDLDYGDRKLTAFALAKAINAHITKHKISILKAEAVDDDFHSRVSAKNKLYVYKILNRTSPSALDRDHVWWYKHKLDVDKMHDAAQSLLGHHDFTTFRDSQCQAKSPIKTLDRLDVIKNGDIIEFHVEGKSFLHHQVRNMVGTLMLVGSGKWTKDDIVHALHAKDRTQGGPTAPASGLYLMRIDYD